MFWVAFGTGIKDKSNQVKYKKYINVELIFCIIIGMIRGYQIWLFRNVDVNSKPLGAHISFGLRITIQAQRNIYGDSGDLSPVTAVIR